MSKEIKPAAQGQLMPRSVIADMAERFGIEKEAFEAVLMKTIMPPNSSKEEMVAFLLVAKQYDLNPFTKEIYAFPKKGGGIQPMVPIDGWLKIINSNPHYDGIEFKDHVEEGELVAITCRIHHKHRSHQIEVTEYMSECRRGTEPWKQWPARMLRHKAVIQCARYAFGLAGIVEPDEAERLAPAVDAPAQPVGSGVAGLRHALSQQQDRGADGAAGPTDEAVALDHQPGERADFTPPQEERQPEPAQAQRADEGERPRRRSANLGE